ncbi:putative RING-H2 finger protein [Tyrophagus putrescentiae]|nr:putative RING-H2 finger protein [Tyrophagus putrescentiae]
MPFFPRFTDDVRNRPVVMISITGPFRKGKSFLLNHFLRYLQASNNEEKKAKVFSESPFDPYYNLPLNGFNWRSGAHPDTKGILIWSKPFITKLKNKNGIEEEVAVLLMDTEGAFDGQHTQAHSTKLFSLVALLIRDWSSPIDYNYGFKGGASLLAKHQLKAVNRSIEDLPEELKRIRNRLIDKYEKIDCFLMPPPGKLVSVQQKEGVFEGQIAFYDNDFLISLKEFVTKLLEGNFLQTKRIGGCNITGEHMLEYFKQLAQLLESDTLPEPKVMVETMGEIINNNAAKETLEEYKNMLILLAGPEVPHIKSAVFKEKNEEFVKICLTKFDLKPKFSFPLVKEKLENDMISLFMLQERQAVSIGITSYSFNPLSILQPTSGNFMYYSHILEGFVAASALYIIVTIKERTLAACQNVHSHHRVQTSNHSVSQPPPTHPQGHIAEAGGTPVCVIKTRQQKLTA